jgi:hypothetical protein
MEYPLHVKLYLSSFFLQKLLQRFLEMRPFYSSFGGSLKVQCYSPATAGDKPVAGDIDDWIDKGGAPKNDVGGHMPTRILPARWHRVKKAF